MKEDLVISMGGSLIFGEDTDISFYKKIKEVFFKYNKEYNFSIICGGGITARKYTKVAATLNLTDKKQDLLGIDATRINARLIMFILNELTTGKVYTSIDDLVSDFGDKITICGGMQPGQRTDKVAALIAEELNIKTLINLTNVDGVFDKDPNDFKDVKLLPRLDYDDFCRLSGLRDHKPSYHFVFDFDAAEVCHQNNIKVIIINGKKVNQFDKYLAKKNFLGSIIEF
ncbi:MAG: UMP kinase [Candidatus Lokiarchaeota archaeon]|nr:UMP kinase [Candidatus Lokiarchaeota archaeon]